MDAITEWGRFAAEQDIIAINAPTEEQRELAKIYAEGFRYMQLLALEELAKDAQVRAVVAKAIVAEMESCLHIGYDEHGQLNGLFFDTVIPNAPTADPYRTKLDLWGGYEK